MRDIKFLGGIEAFKPEQLDNAARTVSRAVVRAHGDPDTLIPSQAEKDVLGDLLDCLGLVAPDDPRAGSAVGMVGSLARPADE